MVNHLGDRIPSSASASVVVYNTISSCKVQPEAHLACLFTT